MCKMKKKFFSCLSFFSSKQTRKEVRNECFSLPMNPNARLKVTDEKAKLRKKSLQMQILVFEGVFLLKFASDPIINFIARAVSSQENFLQYT